MTSIWGPMGWMTIHSISAAYPHSPAESDKLILQEFMDSFANTISCPLCRSHFRDVFLSYKKNVPTWMNSKRDLFMMICRLHNNVNRRLHKPIPSSIQECIDSLKTATSYTTQFEFRRNYLEYLSREFKGNRAISEAFHVERMKKINESYWNSREVSYSELSFEEEDIVNFMNQSAARKLVLPNLSFKNIKFLRRS